MESPCKECDIYTRCFTPNVPCRSGEPWKCFVKETEPEPCPKCAESKIVNQSIRDFYEGLEDELITLKAKIAGVVEYLSKEYSCGDNPMGLEDKYTDRYRRRKAIEMLKEGSDV